MKCWKCGKDLASGADKCLFCGVSLKRILPSTPAGKAMRTLYDQIGMQKVLSEKLYLTTALGDLLQDSQKLRNQLGMAMDSGMGSMYLNQLQMEGKPTSDFQAKVKRVLTEDAGLSDKIALELMKYMDEMIGWQAGADEWKENPTGNTEQPRPMQDELQKLKAEAYQETLRIDALLQKLQPLKNIQALQKDAMDICDELTKINRALQDTINNINRNLNLSSPTPDAVTYSRGALQIGRTGIAELEKKANELFRQAETQNTAAQNTAEPRKDSNNSGKGGCMSGLLGILLFCGVIVGMGALVSYGGPIGSIIVVILVVIAILGAIGSKSKKK